MKIYDKTPLQNANGEIDLFARVRGTLKYGFSWYPDLEAQKLVIAKLDRLLERGYVLIRNFTLPNSEIVIPVILIGPGGVQVLYVTDVKGFFEAKGNEWNTVSSGRSQPASMNLISRTLRLSRAFTVFLQRNRLELPAPVEPVLIAANPGAHLEAIKPSVRVVKSDAINAFAETVLRSSPVLRIDFIHDLADHIINPRPAGERTQQLLSAQKAAIGGMGVTGARPVGDALQSTANQAEAGLPASQPGEMNSTGGPRFASDNKTWTTEVSRYTAETSPSQRLQQPDETQASRSGGMKPRQMLLLGVLVLVEVCVLGGFGILIYLSR
jgi:hypothetical protein